MGSVSVRSFRFMPGVRLRTLGRAGGLVAVFLLGISTTTAWADGHEEESAKAGTAAEDSVEAPASDSPAEVAETEDQAAARIDEATRALLRAADAGSVRRTQMALERGARIDENREEFAGPDRQPALVAAALSGHSRVVRTLLEAGADPMAAEKDGFTVWHAAAFQGRTDVLRVLHELEVPGYDLSPKDGYSPLHRAAWGPKLLHLRAVRFLVGPAGRDCHVVATSGEKPIDRVKLDKIREVLQKCMDESADGEKAPAAAAESAPAPQGNAS